MTFSKWMGLGLAAVVISGSAPAMAGEPEAAKVVAGAKSEQKEAFGRLTVDEVEAGVAKKELFVFDNNSPERFVKGRVPSAKRVGSNDVTAKDLPADKNAKLVFYCGGEKCMACHTAAKAAIDLGYKNVFIMPAGISGWEKAGKKVESGS